MKKLFIKSGKETLAVMIASSETKPDIFFFHGGGLKKEKEKFLYLMRDLAKNGINSLAFDFSGVNESSGSMSESSLQKRVLEAKTVIEKYYNKNQKISVSGFSLGGYVAIEIAQLFNVKNLMLFCPAIYDKKAYKVNFGEKFSEMIRKNESWRNSDAWQILKKYKNNLLLFVPENDEVVPREISEKIYTSAKNCKKRKMVILSDFTHKIHLQLSKKRKIRKEVVNEMIRNL